MTPEQEILLFYGWWQLVVCLFAFLGLLAIWWHLGKNQGDRGQVWLALSILCWSLSGAAEVFFIDQFPDGSQETLLNGLRSVFSLSNSLFILLGLPWFRYLPDRIAPLIKSKAWIVIVGIPFLFSILQTLSRIAFSKPIDLIHEPDIYYAIFTLFFLGIVLWESFYKRKLKWLAWLSVACILTTLMAQILKHPSLEVNPALISSIFKTFLIMIFFALALSWVKELAENIIPSAENLVLGLSKKKNEKGKFVNQVKLLGIRGSKSNFAVSPANYELLLKFVSSRRSGEGWLEIKPRQDDRSGKQYDIQDHNEIKRLLSALLDGLFEKGNWTRELHENSLKSALFEWSEKRERMIRLAMIPENLTMED